MSLFDSVLENKALMKAALGRLAKVMKNEGLEYVVVSIDPEDDGILLKMCKPGEAVITFHENPEETEPQKTIENANSQDRPE